MFSLLENVSWVKRVEKSQCSGRIGLEGAQGVERDVSAKSPDSGQPFGGLLPQQWQLLHFVKAQEQNRPPAPSLNYPPVAFSFAFYFSTFLFIFLSFQRVLENDENVEEGNEEEDLEEDIPKRKNRTRGRVSWGCQEGGKH